MTLEEGGEPTRHVTARSHAERQAHKTETISEFKIHSLLERYTVVSDWEIYRRFEGTILRNVSTYVPVDKVNIPANLTFNHTALKTSYLTITAFHEIVISSTRRVSRIFELS